MKALPIPFTAPMVRALLEGRKTQTRRIIEPQPVLLPDKFWRLHGAAWSEGISRVPVMPGHSLAKRAPYGQDGDLLWVREAWVPQPNREGPGYLSDATWFPPEWAGRWESAIDMPREYSRLTLEITGVRVERLQEISEADAIAEGAWSGLYDTPLAPDEIRPAFTMLWDFLYGEGSWDANPWVWVLEFNVHRMNVDAFLAGRAA
ncbi:ASCH domain-containing protein [Paludisphaera rhizosphaerae]|uniref:hypothetical protein n=1 Tax=Paludisphaera rhizosphaerae TaxID=2711216 RepID=UPI0013EAE8CB|nr:hypothetical protein [Paludisphaera rhizosphaerae]